jgi:hypothetical protein
MGQVPLLLGRFDGAVLDEAAVIIIIKGRQRLAYRRVGQETVFPLGP